MVTQLQITHFIAISFYITVRLKAAFVIYMSRLLQSVLYSFANFFLIKATYSSATRILVSNSRLLYIIKYCNSTRLSRSLQTSNTGNTKSNGTLGFRLVITSIGQYFVVSCTVELYAKLKALKCTSQFNCS
jgi:hypothetical protein